MQMFPKEGAGINYLGRRCEGGEREANAGFPADQGGASTLPFNFVKCHAGATEPVRGLRSQLGKIRSLPPPPPRVY